MKVLTLACSLANSLQSSDSEKCCITTIDLILSSKDPLEVSQEVHSLIKRIGAPAYQQLNQGASKVQFAN